MKKYWRGYAKNGMIISEALGAKWDECKKDIVKLELVLDDGVKEQVISLPKGLEFIQAKTSMGDLCSGICEIESRYIACILGNNIVRIRVNEKTNNISLEID